jgi:hypothetical protein
MHKNASLRIILRIIFIGFTLNGMTERLFKIALVRIAPYTVYALRV